MKIASFDAGDGPETGVIIGDRIHSTGIAGSMIDLIAQWDVVRQSVASNAQRDPGLALEDIRLLAPVARPGKIFAIGLNYADHIAESAMGIPERQVWFTKAVTSINAPFDLVLIATGAPNVDYEAELVAVIGKRGKDIPAAKIRDHVWGVTLSNDWSCRDGMDAPKIVQYNMVKNFDRACSIGPCIAVGEEAFDNIDLETRVNGQVRQSFNSKDMIFTFGEVLEHLSVEFTFVPGDVICGGTAAGTAADRTKPVPGQPKPTDLFLKVGDMVEVSSPQIGKLRNRIV